MNRPFGKPLLAISDVLGTQLCFRSQNISCTQFMGFCFCSQISELEQDKRDLERQVNELKAKCEQIEKRAVEQRAVEEKKHTEEIQFLKRTNQQLKVRATVLLPQLQFCSPTGSVSVPRAVCCARLLVSIFFLVPVILSYYF